MTICNVVWSIFSDMTSEIATPFAKSQDSLPVGSIFYFFSSWSFVPSIGSIAPPWPLVSMFTQTLFRQRSLSALERLTVH